MSVVHLACALAELNRLIAARHAVRVEGWEETGNLERRINELLALSWPCGDSGCFEPVTLTAIIARGDRRP